MTAHCFIRNTRARISPGVQTQTRSRLICGASSLVSHETGKSRNSWPLVCRHIQTSRCFETVCRHRDSAAISNAHVRRVSSMATVCVFITALLVCTTVIIGGVYLYPQFSHDKLRHFRGWYNIPYNSDQQITPKAQSMNASLSEATVTQAWEMVNASKNNFFEEEFDIDIKFEQFEKIEVPSFAHGRKAHFIHDFTVNRTAIADYENRRCFVMFLNERFVFPPRSLYNLITRMRAGFYDADTQVVRQHMRVVTPRVNDMKSIGLIIPRDCNSMPIYMLERATSPVFKRSLDAESQNMFVEFAGNKIVEYKIHNINDAIPGDRS